MRKLDLDYSRVSFSPTVYSMVGGVGGGDGTFGDRS
jgi:hypothetical protein